MMKTAPTYGKAEHAIVLFDGECPLCRKSVAILRKLDWLGMLEYRNARESDKLPESPLPLDPKRLLEQMHLVTRKRVYVGFAAFRWMAWRLPLLTLFAPLLYLPGVSVLGTRLYMWVARNRFRLVPCHEGVCSVPLSPTH